ncbi:hypothetical protein MY11210_003050 [Beauveria gryllotalpidicola]
MADDDLYAADVPQLSPFSRLPHELLLYVARQLSVADLGALRLASQHLSSILRVLLARKEFCAAQIQRVRICSRAVYEDEEQLAWDSGDGAGPVSLEAALWPTIAVAPRLAAHLEEKRIVPLRADLLCEALCRLPKLEELALTWERFPFLSRADMGLDAELLNGGGGGDDDDDADSELRRQLAYTTGGWQREMLVDFLPKTHLANLQSLTLVRAHVASLRDLAAFLQRHARTLR